MVVTEVDPPSSAKNASPLLSQVIAPELQEKQSKPPPPCAWPFQPHKPICMPTAPPTGISCAEVRRDIGGTFPTTTYNKDKKDTNMKIKNVIPQSYLC